MAGRGSEFAEEAVKKYVDRNLAMFHRVQVSQMIHLPCFTDTDRQRIRACCINEGNNMSTFEFLQRMCCREGWVPLFVEALREQNMGDLADKLESVYQANLLPSSRTPPAAAAPPCGFIHEARPFFPSQLATSPANPPPQDTGDYRIPVQENSHSAEESKLAVHPESTDKGEPGVSITSDGHSASNIGAAVGRDRATKSQEPNCTEQALPIRGPVEKMPLRPPTTPTSAAEGPVEQKWDGRQHHPVTVKNGRFGNMPHPDDSGRVSPLPAGTSGNQPEEDHYSSDSVLFPLPVHREDLGVERKVHALRGDGKQEKPPVVDSHLDKQEKNLPASPRSAGERDDIKLPVEEKASRPQITVTSAVAGRPEAGIVSRPSGVRDRQRDSRIFHSNRSEDDTSSKPGVLSSEHTSESSRLDLEPSKLYSGSSERLRMSISDSISGSDNDPILVSNSSSASSSTTSTVWGRSWASGPLDASLPAEVDPGEEDTSLRSHHVRVEVNQSVDLMGVPLDVASSRPSPRASPDSTFSGQPKNETKGQAGPDETTKVEAETSLNDFRLLFAGFVLAAVAAGAFALYKKK